MAWARRAAIKAGQAVEKMTCNQKDFSMKKLSCLVVSLALLVGFALPAQAKMVWKFSTFFDEDNFP